MPQNSPPKWDAPRLKADAAAAVQLFREERMTEPLELYSEHFDAARTAVELLMELTVDLTQLMDHRVAVLSDPNSLEVVRYLAGPPISRDDLEVVADVRMSPKSLATVDGAAARAIETILLGLDHNRFPWLVEARDATEPERRAAIVATASLISARRVITSRANEGKNAQEQRVKDSLLGAGFVEVMPRAIETLAKAPGRGEFCGESLLGDRKADVVVRLWDDRVMAIECKVSNSSTNSVKRLNNDAAVKAVQWTNSFGTAQMVPSAMLAGVFNPLNLVAAQSNGLTIWWSHDLSTMLEWIESTR